jgi:hypothetical protein
VVENSRKERKHTEYLLLCFDVSWTILIVGTLVFVTLSFYIAGDGNVDRGSSFILFVIRMVTGQSLLLEVGWMFLHSGEVCFYACEED